MNQEILRTPLYDLHLSLGAQMGPFGGYMMPISYKGVLHEHHACRKGVVLFDTCHMGEFAVKGPGALESLENLVSCDVGSMSAGQCRYGLMCNDEGGVLDDLLVYRSGPDDFMLVVNAGTQGRCFDWIRAHVSAGTDIENISANTAKFDLQGPGSVRILDQVIDKPVADLKFYHFVTNSCSGEKIIISRTGCTGEIGFEVYCGPDLACELWRRCMDLGAEPAGLGARDTLRLEMGMPLYGHELSVKMNAGESGLERALSRSKNFIGSKVVLDDSRRKKVLAGIRFDGRKAARHGDVVVDGAGNAIGEVTSGSFAPSLEIAVALSYIDAGFGRLGCPVFVTTTRQNIPGVTCELPFYRQAGGRKPMMDFRR